MESAGQILFKLVIKCFSSWPQALCLLTCNPGVKINSLIISICRWRLSSLHLHSWEAMARTDSLLLVFSRLCSLSIPFSSKICAFQKKRMMWLYRQKKIGLWLTKLKKKWKVTWKHLFCLYFLYFITNFRRSVFKISYLCTQLMN